MMFRVTDVGVIKIHLTFDAVHPQGNCHSGLARLEHSTGVLLAILPLGDAGKLCHSVPPYEYTT